MKMWIEMTSAVLLAASMTFSGCSDSDWSTDPASPEKIAASNKIREKLGIRQIKGAWIFYGREGGAEDWKETRDVPCKRVQYDKTYVTILREQDSYYTGRSFPSPDPDCSLTWECLLLFYDYRAERFGLAVSTDDEEIMALEKSLYETTPKGKWLGYMGRTNDETLEVADQILRLWGLDRL